MFTPINFYNGFIMRISLFTALFFLSTCLIYSQIIPSWSDVPNAPFGSRKNDLVFVTPQLGFTASGAREAHRTTNAGVTWTRMFYSDSTFFRSVAFGNERIGFLGNLGPDEYGGASITDPTLIYRTSDGGTTWRPVTNISGPLGRGVCGMHALDSNLVFAVGRVRGPSVFMKSTDGGLSWTSKDMSSLAAGLVDVHFFSPDTGIAVGLTNSEHAQSRGVVLYTTDGGENWSTKYSSSRAGEWCWKISFPSRNTGYISLQRNQGSPCNFIKTTDGGTSFFEKQFYPTNYYSQGIGFVNDTLGWIGGNSIQTTLMSTNGGDTWEPANFGVRINRFFFINELSGFASGQTIYKYTGQLSTGVKENPAAPSDFELSQNYPNPFNPVTKIRFTVPELKSLKAGPGLLYVELKIFDAAGKLVMSVVNEEKQPGENEIEINASHLPSGVYYYQIQAGTFTDTKKMILLK